MRKTKLLAMLMAVFAVSACASLGRAIFQEPIVNFRDLRVRGLGLTGGSIDVFLNVYNPNQFRLDATRLTYRLLVGDNEIGVGALDSRFTVQNGDSTTVRIPIDFTYNGIGSVARQMMSRGAVDYRVMGDVTVGTPLGNFTRPYSGTGRFSAFGNGR